MAGLGLSALLLILAFAACLSGAVAQQTVYPDTISYQVTMNKALHVTMWLGVFVDLLPI